FLQERAGNSAGSAIAVTMEGTRPILLEVQALTANSALGMPRRSANGFDSTRVQMLVAVLSKRVGLPLGGQDIYVNIVGGLRIVEPAIDLAVVVAMASSFRERPVDHESVIIGEVGLSGELRSVNQLERRLNEAMRLGFRRAIVPAAPRVVAASPLDIQILRASTVSEAIEMALTPADRQST
ncbi:MAG TPA: magnesium chelatase domain-containing protein, partial [Nitrolancea sp.]|nr:magnesium chelatase domain-containing protein [Nitrolancea sp.]